MADKGIIFSGPMVKALLDGRKTQTRRLLNSQPETFMVDGAECEVRAYQIDGEPLPRVAVGRCITRQKLHYAPGDHLYVRENFYQFGGPIAYAADGPPEFPRKMTPCIHMPRWASRLWLHVTDVRVQRVQEISEADARAEGVLWVPGHGEITPAELAEGYSNYLNCRDAFAALWNSLHTKPGETWEDNPFVVAISFAVHHGNIDGAVHG